MSSRWDATTRQAAPAQGDAAAAAQPQYDHSQYQSYQQGQPDYASQYAQPHPAQGQADYSQHAHTQGPQSTQAQQPYYGHGYAQQGQQGQQQYWQGQSGTDAYGAYGAYGNYYGQQPQQPQQQPAHTQESAADAQGQQSHAQTQAAQGGHAPYAQQDYAQQPQQSYEGYNYDPAYAQYYASQGQQPPQQYAPQQGYGQYDQSYAGYAGGYDYTQPHAQPPAATDSKPAQQGYAGWNQQGDSYGYSASQQPTYPPAQHGQPAQVKAPATGHTIKNTTLHAVYQHTPTGKVAVVPPPAVPPPQPQTAPHAYAPTHQPPQPAPQAAWQAPPTQGQSSPYASLASSPTLPRGTLAPGAGAAPRPFSYAAAAAAIKSAQPSSAPRPAYIAVSPVKKGSRFDTTAHPAPSALGLPGGTATSPAIAQAALNSSGGLNSSAGARELASARAAKEKAKTGPASEFPPALTEYISRAFKEARTDAEIEEVESELQVIISSARAQGDLQTRNWAEMPLPRVGKRKAGAGAEGQPAKRKKIAGDEFTPSDAVLEARAARFDLRGDDRIFPHAEPKQTKKQKKAAQSKPSSHSQFHVSAIEDGDDVDWTKFIIRGTSLALEKQYLRLTSAPDPSTVRPQAVLARSLEMVKQRWKETSDYHYVCEQLKSIRQDLTVQCIRNDFTVLVYETHARIALEKGDVGEFNQCQSQLKVLFAENIAGHVTEFVAYRILYALYLRNDIDMMNYLNELTPKERRDPAIKHALEVREAIAFGNYHQFFRLFASAPNMGAYLMNKYVDRERIAGLRVMIKAFRPTLPVEYVKKELAFEALRDVQKFLRTQGVVLSKDRKLIDCKESAAAIAGKAE